MIPSLELYYQLYGCQVLRLAIRLRNAVPANHGDLIQNSASSTRSAAGQLMNFCEYQSIQLMTQNAIPTPFGRTDPAKGLVAAAKGLGGGI
jgi:hypothetical protein